MAFEGRRKVTPVCCQAVNSEMFGRRSRPWPQRFREKWARSRILRRSFLQGGRGGDPTIRGGRAPTAAARDLAKTPPKTNSANAKLTKKRDGATLWPAKNR